MLGVMLQIGGAGFSNILNQLENMGFFQYILPFLLIFAVVYAIVTKLHVFKDSLGASVIVAIAIGLLSLQFNVVPAFFQNIFPKFGVGLAVLLVALILAGAFLPGGTDAEKYKWIFFGLGAAIFVIIIILSFSDFQFMGNWWWSQYGTMVIVAIVIIVAMIMVIVASKKGT